MQIIFISVATSFQLELNDKWLTLLNEAKAAQRNSYSPYSKFRVGAAVLTKEGNIFTGCNVENVSYGLTICAERDAIFKAVSEGYTDFEAIAIVGSDSEPTFPCGACRQVLAEFNLNMEVYVNNGQKIYTVSDLLPNSFSKEQIKTSL